MSTNQLQEIEILDELDEPAPASPDPAPAPTPEMVISAAELARSLRLVNRGTINVEGSVIYFCRACWYAPIRRLRGFKTTSDGYANHWSSVHVNVVLMCPYNGCSKGFKYQSCLTRHVNKHHKDVKHLMLHINKGHRVL